MPDNNLPASDTGNSANFFDSGYTTGNFSYPMTDAGAYTLSAIAYGTFDQGGNVEEWNEALISISLRGLREGSYLNYFSGLSSKPPSSFSMHEDFQFGFRVATVVPEPSSLVLAGTALVGSLLFWRRRLGR